MGTFEYLLGCFMFYVIICACVCSEFEFSTCSVVAPCVFLTVSGKLKLKCLKIQHKVTNSLKTDRNRNLSDGLLLSWKRP